MIWKLQRMQFFCMTSQNKSQFASFSPIVTSVGDTFYRKMCIISRLNHHTKSWKYWLCGNSPPSIAFSLKRRYYLGPTQVKCQVSTFNIKYFLCNEFPTFFGNEVGHLLLNLRRNWGVKSKFLRKFESRWPILMLEFNLWYFWKMSEIHCIKNARN